jgi:hypothetical protein
LWSDLAPLAMGACRACRAFQTIGAGLSLQSSLAGRTLWPDRPDLALSALRACRAFQTIGAGLSLQALWTLRPDRSDLALNTALACRPRQSVSTGQTRRTRLAALTLGARQTDPIGAGRASHTGLTALPRRPRISLWSSLAPLAPYAAHTDRTGKPRRPGFADRARWPHRPRRTFETARPHWPCFATIAGRSGFAINTVAAGRSVAQPTCKPLDISNTFRRLPRDFGDSRAPLSIHQLASAFVVAIHLRNNVRNGLAQRFNQNVAALVRLDRGCF